MIHIQYQTEERVVLSDGKTFIPTPQMGCGGCAFVDDEGDYENVCDSISACTRRDRNDRRSVIWVEKKSQNRPHPYAELIKAWADGEKIEEFDPIRGVWFVTDRPSWDTLTSYRVAKQPKQDVVKYFVASQEEMIPVAVQSHANMKCTFDGETGKLKSVEMVNKND